MEDELDYISPYTYLSLPLYQDADYFYVVALEGIAYKLRFYYNLRNEQWVMDIRFANNDPIALGIAAIANYPILIDHEMPFTGFFYLESVGKEQNETVENPFEIWKYYKLFYGYIETE